MPLLFGNVRSSVRQPLNAPLGRHAKARTHPDYRYGPLPRGYRDPLLDNPTRHSQIHRSDTVVRGETLQRFNLRSTGDPTLLIIHRGIDKDNDSIVAVASIHLLYVRSRELEGRDLFAAPNSLDNWFISFINRVNQREKRSPCRTDDNGWILERDR